MGIRPLSARSLRDLSPPSDDRLEMGRLIPLDESDLRRLAVLREVLKARTNEEVVKFLITKAYEEYVVKSGRKWSANPYISDEGGGC